MSRVTLSRANWALDGVVTALSELPSLPATLLQTPEPSIRWRSTPGTTATGVRLDMGATQSVGVVALWGLGGVSAATTVRTRVSANSNLSSPTHDVTGAAGDGIDLEIGFFLRWITTASGRYVGVDLATASQPEAGVLWVGPRWTPSINMAAQDFAPLAPLDLSRKSRAPGGRLLVDRGPILPGCRIAWGALARSEMRGEARQLAHLVGAGREILLSLDTEDTALGTVTFYGTPELAPEFRWRAYDAYSGGAITLNNHP